MTREKNEKKETEIAIEMTILLMLLNNSSRIYSAKGSVRALHSKDNTNDSKPLVGPKSTRVIICSGTASCNAALVAS